MESRAADPTLGCDWPRISCRPSSRPRPPPGCSSRTINRSHSLPINLFQYTFYVKHSTDCILAGIYLQHKQLTSFHASCPTPNTQTYILSNVEPGSSILPLQIIAQLKGLDIVHLSNYRHLSRFNWWTFDTESDLLVIWKSQSITLVSGDCCHCSTIQGSLLQRAHSSPVPVTGDHCDSDTAPA